MKAGVRALHKCSCLEVSFESQGQETDSSGEEPPSCYKGLCESEGILGRYNIDLLFHVLCKCLGQLALFMLLLAME